MFRLSDFTVTGLDFSPIKHLRLIVDNNLERLEKIVKYVSQFFHFQNNLARNKSNFFYRLNLNQFH